jgi:hypothetical protein
MVVIAEATRKLLGNLFELEDLGAKNLKGITGPLCMPGPVYGWHPLSPSTSVSSRSAAQAAPAGRSDRGSVC